jgi:acetate kinase
VIDDDVRRELGELVPLAPLHQPRSLAGIDALVKLLPDVRNVACFDTAFHATMPAPAVTYALPAEWVERWPLRRFGFHGLSHAYGSRRAAELVGGGDDLRIVTCHLGSGASCCAVAGGRSVDTTMGFTPLEGLVMSTRSGTVDPGLVLWLVEQGHLSAEDVDDGLQHRAGLAGLYGGKGDLRDVVPAANGGDQRAAVALGVYLHRLVKEVAGLVAVLGGLDVLVFTGGVGEHQPPIRAATVDRLSFLGLSVDDAANRAASADAVISPPGVRPATVVVTAREDLQIARETRALVER